MSKFNYGVRTTAARNAWIQTGFTKEQAEAEAKHQNDLAILPGVVYVADIVR